MNKLKLFQENDAESLYGVAKYLFSKTQFWNTYLNHQQLKILHKIFDSKLSKDDSKLYWKNLIDGSLVIKDNKNVSFDNALANSKAISLRVRSLLWGRATSFYYNMIDFSDSNVNNEDFDILEDDDSDYEDSKTEQDNHASSSIVPPTSTSTRVTDEDDDYDDDEDDEEEEKKTDNLDETTEKVETAKDQQEFYNEFLILDMIDFRLEKSDDGISNDNSNKSTNENLTTTKMSTSLNSSDTIVSTQELEIIKKLNNVYHNFENDKETLMKRLKLVANDKLVDEQSSSNNSYTENQSLASQLSMNIGSASLSLKYLLKLIDNNKEKVPNLTNRELQNLIHDVKKSKSKWSSDDRIGQEELYEACEKVVVELRGYTQHSTPFLTKVSKREAPNYYQIIKKPMDLNTVSKKLKNLEYKSKNDFVADLMLIWNNCLTYNTDPAHQLRKDAMAMRKKTQSLMPLIPDIVIRTRAEIEKEEKEIDKQINARTNQKKLTGGKGLKRTSNGTVKPTDDSTASPQVTPAPIQSIASQSMMTDTPEPTVDEDMNESQVDETENENVHPQQLIVEDDSNDDGNDLEAQIWNNYTSKLRGDFLLRRSKLFVKDSGNKLVLNSEAEAVLRDPVKMSEFLRIVSGEVLSNPANNEPEEVRLEKPNNTTETKTDGTNSKLENAADLQDVNEDYQDDNGTDDLYLTEYDVINGIPMIGYTGQDQEYLSKQENHILEKLNFERKMNNNDNEHNKKSEFSSPSNGSNKLIMDNITQMQEIRKICFKISLIRQMQQNQFIHHTQLKAPIFEKVGDLDLNPLEQRSENVVFDHKFNANFIYNILKKNVGKILMNTGFETADPHAVEIITQIAENFLGNLAKTIKLHTETRSKNRIQSGSDILLLSLLENGIGKPDDIYSYVKDGVLKQNSKLKELRSKLTNFLKDLLRPTLMNFQSEKDLINEKNFTDNSDQFITGDFSNEIGDDFFGFRELGLDKEFHLLSSSIPLHLLNSRLNNSLFNSQNSNDGTRSLIEGFDKNIKYNKLYKADIEKQVGLAHPFLNKFFEKSKVIYLRNYKNNNTTNKELPFTNKDEEMLILEDEDFPQKQRNIRPRLPPNGKISSVKKRAVGNGYFLPEDN